MAIETVTTEVAAVPTLIFDEVDAGIGGGVAEIVGRMLKTLGDPPLLSRIGSNLRQVRDASTVELLAARERIEEIARMLGGVKITDLTRKHAAELLASG